MTFRRVLPLFVTLWLPALATPACAPPLDSGSAGGGSGGSGGAGVCAPGATEACYSGPSGTEDVGACHAGTRTCAADGSGFGACEGEVQPQAEEGCTGAVDLNCDGVLAGCHGAVQWSLPLAGDLDPAAIAASSDGESTLAGWAHTLDIGAGAQGDPAVWSLVVARIGAHGSPRWLRMFPGVDAAARSGRVAMSEAHEATIVVRVEGTPVIEGTTLDATSGGVLALRFADDGALTAAALVDLSGPDGALPVSPRAARVDGDGVLIGGDGFLARVDAGLQTTWHHRYAGDVTFADIATGPDGERFATGSYEGAFEPGGGAAPVSGNHAAFLAKLEGEGLAWSEQLGGEVETKGLSLTVRDDGALRITGSQAGSGELVDNVGVDYDTGFVADRSQDGKLDSTFIGLGPRRPESVTVDANGNYTTRAMPLTSLSSVILKSPPWKNSILWMADYYGPLVSAALYTGETIIATPDSVEMLGR